jgi:hypothetical protein
MNIQLLAPETNTVVDMILAGELPPATSDPEVIRELARRSLEAGTELNFWRIESRADGQECVVEYGTGGSRTFADTSHWPEPRPQDSY